MCKPRSLKTNTIVAAALVLMMSSAELTRAEGAFDPQAYVGSWAGQFGQSPTLYGDGWYPNGYYPNPFGQWVWGNPPMIGVFGFYPYYPDYYELVPAYYPYVLYQFTAAPIFPAFANQASNPPAKARSNAATIDIIAPPGAEVSVAGKKITPTGSKWSFTTPELNPGESQTIEVRATWNAGAEPVTVTRSVQVQAANQRLVNLIPADSKKVIGER